jgi:hypothetical protein
MRRASLGRGLARPGHQTVYRDAMAVEFVKEVPVAERLAALEARILALEGRLAALTRAQAGESPSERR